MILSEAEKQIIEDLRKLPPYGRIEITADQTGKKDTYLVHISQKKVIK